LDLHGASRKLKENDMNTGTIALYDRDGHEQTFTAAEISRMASCGQVGAGKDWTSVAPPPIGWEKIIPKYLATRDLRPAERARYRLEPPFSTVFDSEIWQYSDRTYYKANEEITTKSWPHPSMKPLNYSAERVLAFFNSRIKSRLATTPWHIDRLRLDDGLTGTVTIVDRSRSPQPSAAPSPPPRVQQSMRRVV
jgi:hypothetical protein